MTREQAANVLGVPHDADPSEVRRAWRIWARLAHPDAGGSPEHFRRLAQARDALLDGSVLQTAISITEVSFRKILPDEAIAYWQSGEPLDKAGAYAIQGQGGAFVVAISGSYSGVVGLPAYETSELLQKAGVDILNTGSPDER